MDAAAANQNALPQRNEQRRIWREVIAFVTSTSCSLLQIQSANSSLTHGQSGEMHLFVLAILAYAIAQPEFLHRFYPNHEVLISRLNRLFGTLVVVSVIMILVPTIGAFLCVVWVCWFTREVIWTYQEYLHEPAIRVAINLYESLKIYLLGDRQPNGGAENII